MYEYVYNHICFLLMSMYKYVWLFMIYYYQEFDDMAAYEMKCNELYENGYDMLFVDDDSTWLFMTLHDH